MNKNVSVIIPTYNREFSILSEAIDSVINQTYKNIEVIVVDDNNENRRKELDIENKINNYLNVKYIKHDSNKGLSQARNTGILNSTGEYITFLDDDDLFETNRIESMVKEIEKYDDSYGLVNTSRFVLKNNKKEILHTPVINGYGLNHLLEKGNYVIMPLVKKECFDKVGLFDINMKHSEDFEMYLRLLKEYKICCLDIPSYVYRFLNLGQMTFNYKEFIKSNKYIENKHKDIYLNNKKARYDLLIARSKAYAHIKDIKESYKAYFDGIKCNILNVINNILVFGYINYLLVKRKG